MNKPKLQHDIVIPGLAGAFLEIGKIFENAAPRPQPKKHLADVVIKVKRGFEWLPVQVSITDQGAEYDGWFTETKGEYKEGTSTSLTPEEMDEAEQTYNHNEELEWRVRE